MACGCSSLWLIRPGGVGVLAVTVSVASGPKYERQEGGRQIEELRSEG